MPEFTSIDYRKFDAKNYADLIIPIVMKLRGILTKDDLPLLSTRLIFLKFSHDEPPMMNEQEIIYPTSNFIFLAPITK